MDYAGLKEGIDYFRKRWPNGDDGQGCTYASLRDRGSDYWLHLDRLSTQDIGQQVITDFLNTKEWNCHIPARTFKAWFAVSQQLKEAVDQLPEYYAALNDYSIVDVDFSRRIALNSQQQTIMDVVNHVYSTFLRVKPKFGRVPASKLMHMALPGLFAMWDNGILGKYCIPLKSVPGVKSRQPVYVAFLVLMQEHVHHIARSYSATSSEGERQVVQSIEAEIGGLPISRLLDMANMAVRDCEQVICIECMRIAKRRWAALDLVAEDDSNSACDSSSGLETDV